MGCKLHFNEGDEVEVTSQEEGYIGSWYIGTIIRRSERAKKKSFLVEYHTLKEEENGLIPLREFVPGSNIRHRPPSEITPFFQLNEEVDAYYNDGWWQGVIIEVLDGCRYAVYFPPTKEEMEFGQSELRSHLEWVDGTWVRSQDREKWEPVEVKFDEENLLGAWFPATVLKAIRKGSFLIEYTRSRNGDNGVQLKGIVESQNLRPSRPHDSVFKTFYLLDKVDAYYDFGWWSGVITKILTGNKYLVFFMHQNEEKEFKQSKLRLHMEWTDGRWLRDSEETSVIQQYESRVPTGNTVSNIDMATPLSSSAGEDNLKRRTRFSSRNLGPKIDTPSFSNKVVASKKRTIERMNPKRSAAISQSNKRAKNREETKNTIPFQPDCIIIGSSTNKEVQDVINWLIPKGKRSMSRCKGGKSLTAQEASSVPLIMGYIKDNCASSSSCNANAKHDLQGDRSGTELSIEPISDHVLALEHSQIIVLPDSEVQGNKAQPMVRHSLLMKQFLGRIETKQQRVGRINKHTVNLIKRKKRGRPRKEDLRREAAVKGNGKKNLGQESLKALHSSIKFMEGLVHEEAPSSEMMDIIIPTECTELVSHTAGERVQLAGLLEASKSTRGPSLNNWLMTNKKSDALENLELRKSLAIVEWSHNLNKQQVPDESANAREDELSESANGGYDELNESANGGPEHEQACNRGTTAVTEECAEQLSHIADKHIIISASLKNSSYPPVANNGGVSSSNGITLTEATTQADAPEHLQRKNSLAIVEGSHSLNGEPISNDVREDDQNETVVESVLVDVSETTLSIPSQGNAPPATRILPFMKRLPLWGKIDAMDAFLQIPQQPHFRPLELYNEELREGIAIGYMLSFANLMNRTLEARLDGPRKSFEDKLLALDDLEKHGLFVRPLRSRLEKMLGVKDKYSKLDEDSKAAYKQIAEERDKRDKLEAEIKELKKTIADLNLKLQSIIAKKEMERTTVAELERTVDAIKENLRCARLNFNRILAAPW